MGDDIRTVESPAEFRIMTMAGELFKLMNAVNVGVSYIILRYFLAGTNM